MQFLPLTEEEIMSASLLPDGIYHYKVIKSEHKISTAGNEYIAMTLKVYDDNGNSSSVFTNLSLKHLLKHFCDVNGLQDDYQSGNLPPDKCLFKSSGRVVISKEAEKPNGNGGWYPPKNVVKDYIKEAKGSTLMPLGTANGANVTEFKDSDIPF